MQPVSNEQLPMIRTFPKSRPRAGSAFSFRRVLTGTVFLLLCHFSGNEATAGELTRLQRLEIHKESSATRLELKLSGRASYKMAQRPDRVQLTLKETDGPLYRQLNGYGDPHIAGIRLS